MEYTHDYMYIIYTPLCAVYAMTFTHHYVQYMPWNIQRIVYSISHEYTRLRRVYLMEYTQEYVEYIA